MRLASLAVLPLIAGSTLALAQATDPVAAIPEATGRIESVTVYRGQALVTRVIELPPAAGGSNVREVVVTDLPPAIQPGSLHAEGSGGGGGGGAAIRSVVFRAKPVDTDVREEVRAIDAKIERIQTDQATATRRAALMQEHAAYINSLQGFVAPSANAELSKGVLNADTLSKLSQFIFSERERIATTQLEIDATQKRLALELDLANREKAKITSGTSRSINQAIVSIAADAQAPATIRLRYLVENASWSPSYAVRAPEAGESKRTGVTLEYYASVSQMSGEDWSNVAMTLSTATPSLVAKSPTLTAMNVRLADATAPATAKQAADAKGYAVARDEFAQQLRKAELERNRFGGEFRAQRQEGVALGVSQSGFDRWDDATLAFDNNLNSIANDIQLLDLIADKRITKQKASAPAHEQTFAVTYSIPGSTTLASRAQQQQIQITSAVLPAEYTKVATPVLTEFVYDEALVTNASKTVLLAGPVTAYSGGAFVGSGDIPTTAIGQSFTVGLGIDSSLRASRELIERTDNVQGGNRVVDVTYRIAIENFGGAPAQVRVLDRIPKGESQVMVNLVSSSVEPSKGVEADKARKDGILRWDITVPPNGSETSAGSIEYKFRLEHDKQMSLIGLKN